MYIALCFLLISFIFTPLSFSVEKDRMRSYFRLDSKQREMLKTVSSDEKNRLLRFFYPRLRSRERFVDIKGYYLILKSNGKHLKFYSNNELKGSPVVTFKRSEGLQLQNGKICIEGSKVVTEEKEFLECEPLKCKVIKKKIELFKYTEYTYMLQKSKESCPESISVNWFDERFMTGLEGWFIPVSSIDYKNKIAVVLTEFNRPLFISLADYLANPKNGELVKLESSKFERDYLLYMSPPNKAEEYRLKHWRKHLLPCVKKKDKECILKFITNNTLKDIDQDMLKYFPNFGASLTDENLKELEACILKGKLLPHGFAYIGEKKVCILDKYFNSEILASTKEGEGLVVSKIVTVEFPEAIVKDPESMSPSRLDKDIFYGEI
jgi:hypothetical protein